MVLIGKITFRKRGESDRGRKRLKKNGVINPFFFNNDSLFIFPLMPLFLFLIPPFLFSPVLPLFPLLIPFFFRSIY